MKRQAEAGVHEGWPYSAVGMHRALDSSIGFPSRSTRASRMLVFVTPPDVRRSFKLPPEGVDVGENVLGAYRSVRGRDWQAGENSSGPARSSVLSSRDISERSRTPCTFLPTRRWRAPAMLGGMNYDVPIGLGCLALAASEVYVGWSQFRGRGVPT